MYILVPEKHFYPTHITKSIPNKTTTFKQRCRTPTAWHTHTHTHLRQTNTQILQTPTHSFTCSIKILLQQGLLFVTICAWRTKSNEAEEEGEKERKEAFLLVEGHFSVSSLQMDPAASPVAICPGSNIDGAVEACDWCMVQTDSGTYGTEVL